MIERLQVTDLRNLNTVKMQAAACNVIIGPNGSGKTSLLEAIFLLSRGKSFRHSQPKRYIQHNRPSTTVHALLSDALTLAIQKQTDATTILRLNQTTVYNQSILTEQLPTLLIDPSSMDMLEQGSANRRQLLDWLVFHMKPEFHPQWVAYQRLLKQRNSLLKQTKSLSQAQLAEIKAWDKGLANNAALIHHYREQVFLAWQPYFEQSMAQLLPTYAKQISLSYHAGYDVDTPLDMQLNERLSQDLQLGYTRIGSHRADIHVHWRSENDGKADLQSSKEVPAAHQQTTPAPKLFAIKEQAANVLSRGEKKLLITALRLSQLPLLLNIRTKQKASKPIAEGDESKIMPVVLLDDITAELDHKAVDILLSTLAQLPCQVFLTSLTADVLSDVSKYWSDFNTFHMKQGELTFSE